MTSSDPTLDVFAIKEANGDLELMVINKAKTGLNNDTTGTPAIDSTTFNIAGFIPSGSTTMWQYGSAEDNAQEHSATGRHRAPPPRRQSRRPAEASSWAFHRSR